MHSTHVNDALRQDRKETRALHEHGWALGECGFPAFRQHIRSVYGVDMQACDADYMVSLMDEIEQHEAQATVPELPSCHQKEGVYILYDKTNLEIFYVGRTTDLSQRLQGLGWNSDVRSRIARLSRDIHGALICKHEITHLDSASKRYPTLFGAIIIDPNVDNEFLWIDKLWAAGAPLLNKHGLSVWQRTQRAKERSYSITITNNKLKSEAA